MALAQPAPAVFSAQLSRGGSVGKAMAANQGPASRANHPLWGIAFALVVIAACLMVLVLRQRIPLGRVAESGSPPTAKGADLIPASAPQKSPGNLPAIARPRQKGAALSEPA